MAMTRAGSPPKASRKRSHDKRRTRTKMTLPGPLGSLEFRFLAPLRCSVLELRNRHSQLLPPFRSDLRAPGIQLFELLEPAEVLQARVINWTARQIKRL